MTPTAEDTDKQKPESKWRYLLIPLKDLTWDEAFQVRGETDPGKVCEYADYIREHGKMDAIAVFTEDFSSATPTLLVADGFHRFLGYEQAGVPVAPCKVREGNRTDALKYALRENGHHGAAMTNTQKRHAATMAVSDKSIGEMTDKEIAVLIGCSASLVASARKGETPAAVTEKVKQKRAPAEKPEPPSAASGRRETESPAPPSSTSRERRPKDNRPTKTQLLAQVEGWLTADMIDEADLVAMMSTANGEHFFCTKPGNMTRLKIVGKNGRAQVDIQVSVKDIRFEGITVKFEDGKVQLAEEPAS